MTKTLAGPISFKPFKAFNYLLNRLLRAIAKKNINNYPQMVIFSFDHIGMSINLDGQYEAQSLCLVEKLIEERFPNSKDFTAVDIGANIGNHSVFFSKLFKQVISFEPNPVTFEVLKINSKYASATKNITPVCLGLSNSKAKLNFRINPTNIGGSSIVSVDDKVQDNSALSLISVDKADDLSALQAQKIGLIKIDIEGHEIYALEGAKRLIKNNMPYILFEQGQSEVQNGTSVVIDYLLSLNYQFEVIEKRFYLGESRVSKVIAFILRSLFGDGVRLIAVEHFEKRFYDMIIATPKSGRR